MSELTDAVRKRHADDLDALARRPEMADPSADYHETWQEVGEIRDLLAALEHAERALSDSDLERRSLASAITALLHDETVAEMMDPEYVHVVTCNASRDAPVGNEGCSCPIGKRIALLRTRLGEAEQRGRAQRDQVLDWLADVMDAIPDEHPTYIALTAVRERLWALTPAALSAPPPGDKV